MKKSKDYQLPTIKVINIKPNLMQLEPVSTGENIPADSIDADFEEVNGKSGE